MPTETLGQQIASAALRIAAANHYLVGFDSETARDLSFDDLSDAKQILINIENADTKRQHKYALAFDILAMYCRRVHHCDL